MAIFYIVNLVFNMLPLMVGPLSVTPSVDIILHDAMIFVYTSVSYTHLTLPTIYSV